jgi:hypothetical protein
MPQIRGVDLAALERAKQRSILADPKLATSLKPALDQRRRARIDAYDAPFTAFAVLHDQTTLNQIDIFHSQADEFTCS